MRVSCSYGRSQARERGFSTPQGNNMYFVSKRRLTYNALVLIQMRTPEHFCDFIKGMYNSSFPFVI